MVEDSNEVPSEVLAGPDGPDGPELDSDGIEGIPAEVACDDPTPIELPVALGSVDVDIDDGYV